MCLQLTSYKDGMTVEERNEAKKKSLEIDKIIEKESKGKQAEKKPLKLLLLGITPQLTRLGPGNSGKTTFLKQLKILHGEGFKEEDLKEIRKQISRVEERADVFNKTSL